jgi:hypothetical protein
VLQAAGRWGKPDRSLKAAALMPSDATPDASGWYRQEEWGLSLARLTHKRLVDLGRSYLAFGRFLLEVSEWACF